MRNQLLLSFITAIMLFFFPSLNFAQAPNLGAAANFVFFTSVGAVAGNAGVSHINGGDIGTNSGAITGFDNSTTSGKFHNTDALTNQASKDIFTAYNQMQNTIPTVSTHANAFGNGEVLVPGVYSLAGAVSIAGTLTLDGQNNANSVFIFKTSAGAFTTGNYAKIILTNGASACNVVWVIQGAISFAAYANMQGTFISYNGAFSMEAGSTLNGRGYSTNGAIGVNAVSVSIPSQCSDYIATKWIGGTTSDWNNASNWNNLIVPTASSKITIPFGAIPYPIINSGIDSVLGITIESGATVTVTGATLKIGGQINNSGTFDVSAGTIEMIGISPQIIAANTFANNNIRNLIVSNNVTLAGQQNIIGTLSFGNSNDSLFTGDSLTLKSTALGTAMLADITSGGKLSGNVIKGKMIIERYVPAKRSWRLLSVPISTVNAPSINTAWQEGQGGNSTSNTNPGYGVQITGGTTANGFDQGINANTSIKIYNNSNNTLTGLPAASGTNISITSYPGYFLFVRGSRSTNLLQGTSAAPTPATLRIKGQIFTGDTIVNVNAANVTLVGNPYPSPIDFHALIKTNVNDKVYVWDPKINGGNGVGGYVVLLWNTDGYYDKTSSASVGISQYIQSGEAFFVESSDGNNPGSLSIKEKNKNAGGSDFVFKPMTVSKKLRVNLFAIGTTGIPSLSDGLLTTYNDENSNAVDRNDAKKMYNVAENICIGREGKDLAIERRKTISNYDTTFLKLYNLKKQIYQLQITAEGFDSISLHAIIKDNYLGSVKDTALNMGGITNINFTVNSDTASYAVNRFSIVFKQDIVVIPVNFSFIKADRILKDIVVEWKVENEIKIKNYEVEISLDGVNFTKAFSLFAQANNGSSQTYKWDDKYVAAGMHYYRIKSTDINGKFSYSLIVNVSVKKEENEKNIIVFGNVLKDNQVSIRFNNIDKGSYSLKLYAMDGNLVKQFSIQYPGGSNTNNFIINNYFPSGKYEIILSGKAVNYKTSLIKE